MFRYHYLYGISIETIGKVNTFLLERGDLFQNICKNGLFGCARKMNHPSSPSYQS